MNTDHKLRTVHEGFAALLVFLSFFVFFLSVAPVCAASPASQAAAASQAARAARFEGAVKAFEAQDESNPPPKGAVLFLGSSSIERWKTLATDFPNTAVINRGIGGTYISDAVYFADRIVLPYHPRLIVLGAGTNDIADGKTPEQLLADFQAFVTKVRATLPETRIAFLGINPAPSRWAQRDRQQAANLLIKSDTASGENMEYIPLWDVLLGPDGKPRQDLFVSDGLHPSAAGYQVRAAAVRPYLK